MTVNTTAGHIDSSWRKGFIATEKVQRARPVEFKGDLLNPHIGTATFQRFNGDPVNHDTFWDDTNGPEQALPFSGSTLNKDYPQTTVAYCRWAWNHFEPTKGNYQWHFIDNALKAAAERGQTLQIRMQPYVGVRPMPDWYYAAGGTYENITTPGKERPDHNNPLYLEHFGQLIKDLGARYNGHPTLESIDLAIGGPCGENEGNANADTAHRITDIYLEAFSKTQILGIIRSEGTRYAMIKTNRQVGWRADCYGDLRDDGKGQVPDHLCFCHMYDAYPRLMSQIGLTETWKTAPLTLETCWTVPHWVNKKWDIDLIIEMGLRLHPSIFMPKGCFFPKEVWDKMMAFNRRLGYRFVLRQGLLPLKASPGQRVPTEWVVDNVGVAPIYRPYQFALRFRQGAQAYVVPLNQNLRQWLPDQHFFAEDVRIPAELSPGTVAVDAGIIDPQTQQAKVKFAIEDVLPDSWHPLTHIDLVQT